jgi:hypothetical protein
MLVVSRTPLTPFTALQLPPSLFGQPEWNLKGRLSLVLPGARDALVHFEH